MQFSTYLESPSQLKQILKTSIREVILEHKSLSRMGSLDTKSLLTLIDAALVAKMSPVLQWDILSTEKTFQHSLSLLSRLPLAKILRNPRPGSWSCRMDPAGTSGTSTSFDS